MQFKKFGRTGLTVSRLALGTGTFGHQTDEAEAFNMISDVLKAVASANTQKLEDVQKPIGQRGEALTARLPIYSGAGKF